MPCTLYRQFLETLTEAWCYRTPSQRYRLPQKSHLVAKLRCVTHNARYILWWSLVLLQWLFNFSISFFLRCCVYHMFFTLLKMFLKPKKCNTIIFFVVINYTLQSDSKRLIKPTTPATTSVFSFRFQANVSPLFRPSQLLLEPSTY